jgi:hypothetical protein
MRGSAVVGGLVVICAAACSDRAPPTETAASGGTAQGAAGGAPQGGSTATEGGGTATDSGSAGDEGGSAGSPVDPGTGGCRAAESPEPDPADGGVHEGPLEITGPGLAAALANYSTIRGDLTIGPSAPSDEPLIEQLDLSHLRVVEGSVFIRNTDLTELALPRLETVTGELWIRLNLALTHISAPQLRSADSFYLDSNTALRTSEFPKLETVTSTLYVHRNVLLVSWGFDALRSLGSATITANPALPTCLVDALGDATGLTLSSELTGNLTPPACDCSVACGQITPVCA